MSRYRQNAVRIATLQAIKNATSVHEEMHSRKLGRVALGTLVRMISKSRALAGLGQSSIGDRLMLERKRTNACLPGIALCRARDAVIVQRWLRRGGRNRSGLDFAQNFAQHGSQLLAAHLALAELHAHMKRIILGAIVE